MPWALGPQTNGGHAPMYEFEHGVFIYNTLVGTDHTLVEIRLDLNHMGVRKLINRAIANESKQAVVGGGALKVRVAS